MGATEQPRVRAALQVVSYLQPWEDAASPWNGWEVLTGWVKLLKWELGQESGVNISSPTKKVAGDFHCGQALRFSHGSWKMWEKKKKGHLLQKCMQANLLAWFSCELESAQLVDSWFSSMIFLSCSVNAILLILGFIPCLRDSWLYAHPLILDLRVFHTTLTVRREFPGDWMVSERIAPDVIENYVYGRCSRHALPWA